MKYRFSTILLCLSLFSMAQAVSRSGISRDIPATPRPSEEIMHGKKTRWANQKLWRKNLRKGKTEAQTMGILGKPKYIERASDSTTLYYQTMPHVERDGKGKVKLIIPKNGCVHLGTKEKDIEWTEHEKSKVQKQSERSRQSSRDRMRRNAIARQQQIARRRGRYIDERTIGEVGDTFRHRFRVERPVQRVVGWVEPDWNNLSELEHQQPFLHNNQIVMNSQTKWKNVRTWQRLKLNMLEKQVVAVMGDPSAKHQAVEQVGQNRPTRQSAEQRRNTSDSGQWYRCGPEVVGGVLRFSYDSTVQQYRLTYWIEPFWPEILKGLTSPQGGDAPRRVDGRLTKGPVEDTAETDTDANVRRPYTGEILEVRTVTSPEISVRKGPGLSYEPDESGEIFEEEKLYVLEEKDGWIRFLSK